MCDRIWLTKESFDSSKSTNLSIKRDRALDRLDTNKNMIHKCDVRAMQKQLIVSMTPVCLCTNRLIHTRHLQ